MNHVTLLGRLVRDPELKPMSNGKSMVRLTLAVDRAKQAGQEKAEADFINCVAWDKRAEMIAKYFNKGSRILVEGIIRTGSYTNQQGQKVNTFDVWINGVEFIDKKISARSSASPMDSFGTESQLTGFDEEIPF